MFIVLKDVVACEAHPFPWSSIIANELFEERTKSQRAVIAIGQQNHARSASSETDEIVLNTGYPSFFRKGKAVTRSRKQDPTQTGRKAETITFSAGFGREGRSLVQGVDGKL